MITTLETPVEPSTPRIRDKYDEAIEYLTKHPEEIYNAWNSHRAHKSGCLFYYASVEMDGIRQSDGIACGCLTQIRRGGSGSYRSDAETPELTAAIRAELSIPDNSHQITIHHLPIFAKWQRRLDRELGRT